MAGETQTQLFEQISARLQSIGEQVSEARIRTLINEALMGLQNDTTFVRKMRFGAGNGDAKLFGSKFARYDLDAADIEWLYDLQVSIQGQKRVNGAGLYGGPSEALQTAFKTVSDALYLSDEEVKALDMRALDDVFPRLPIGMFRGYDRELAKRGRWEQTKLYAQARGTVEMDTAQSGFGSQLVGAQYVGDLWAAARGESRVFALLDTFEMTAPTAYLPVEVDIPEMMYVSETNADTVYGAALYALTKTGSQRVSVAAKKFIINQIWTGEMEEDSITPFVPFLRRQAAFALAFYSDSVVVNGDTVTAGTGNVNSDDAAPAATKHYLAFDGLRKAGIVDNTANSKDLAGPISFNALKGARGRMLDSTRFVDWGHPVDPSDLVRLADPITADAITKIDEVTTLDKYGPKATILNGDVGQVDGIPTISTVTMSLYDVDGKYTTTSPSTNDLKGEVVTFNRRGLKVGWRRRVKMESERLLGTDTTRLFHSLRLGMGRFSPTGAASGIEFADVIYDITV